MAEKSIPGGTEKLPDNPQLANLKDREQVLVDELARLEKMDANKITGAHDFQAVKQRATKDLAEIRKAIAELKK